MGKISDFKIELEKRAESHFAVWHTIDLHNHTPDGDDYLYKQPDCEDKIVQQIRAKDLSVVMFTDHNQLPDQNLIERLARKTGRLVLRGVELNIFVEAWQKPQNKVDKALYFHLLIGFDPEISSPEYWIEHIRRNCRQETRESGGTKLTGIASSIDQLCEILRDANALIIPAHLHSTRDAFKSRSIDDVYNDPEFLRHAREHFTALEVISESTSKFFDGTHPETRFLHKSCIRSSDSHEPEKLGWRPSYVQMQECTFSQLKSALQLPFRTSLQIPDLPASYVVGIRVQGQFLNDFWVSFSPYCNAFIGVKGSGKTSLLESLRFVLGAEVPTSRVQAVTEHLNAILGPAGRVSALIRRSDGTHVLIERSIIEKTFTVTFENGREEKITRPEALHFPAYILGWHEIEQAATDINIRRIYMDNIAGRDQIQSLTMEAEALCASIRNHHERAANLYGTYKQLDQQVLRLKELRKGLQELTDANLIELKEQYQAAIEHREALRTTILKFNQAKDSAITHIGSLLGSFNRSTLEGSSPLAEIMTTALSVVDEVLTSVRDGGESIRSKLEESVRQLQSKTEILDQEFQRFAEDYSRKIANLSREQQELLESHRRVMEQTRSLPTAEAERGKSKQELEQLLRELISLCDKVSQKLDERFKLRQTSVARFSDDVRAFDIRMSVMGYQTSTAMNALSQRYSHGARLWSDLRSHCSDRLAHLSLKKGYENLLNDLQSGYSLFFENGAIPLTQVTTICSVRARGRLSSNARRLRGPLCDRKRVSGVSDSIALAGWIPLPCVRAREVLARAGYTFPMRELRAADLGHRWHDLSRYADLPAHMVPCHVVGHQPEDRSECNGSPTSLGFGELRNSVGLAAQAASSDGAPGSGPTLGYGRSRRILSRCARKGRSGSANPEESIDCGRGRGGRCGNRPYPDAPDSGRVGGQSPSLRRGRSNAGQCPAHRRTPQLRPSGETWLRTSDHIPQRQEGITGGVTASRTPRGGSSKTLAAWHPSGRCQPSPLGLLPRRVHLPVQQAHIPASWKTVLPACTAGRRGRSGSVSLPHQARARWQANPAAPTEPQQIVAT